MAIQDIRSKVEGSLSSLSVEGSVIRESLLSILDELESISGGDITITKSDITDFNDSDYEPAGAVDSAINGLNLGTASQSNSEEFATASQGSEADTALQPGDNISELTNDAGYLTEAPE